MRLEFAVDISKDGNRIIVGSFRGRRAQVFEWDGTYWRQIGSDLTGYGNLSNYGYGYAVAMAKNGNRIAISDPQGTANGQYVHTYDWDGANWVQIGGSNGIREFANSIALSENGDFVAIGAIGNDDNGEFSGHTRVYQKTGNSWYQIQNAISTLPLKQL